MDKILEIITDKIQSPLALTGMFIIFTVLYFLKNGLNSFIEKLNPKDFFKTFKRRKDFQYNLNDLGKHDLFNELEIHKRQRFEFETHGQEDLTKALVFKDFLNAKLSATSENMLKISTEATNEMSKQELKQHVNNCFNECNRCLERNLKVVFAEKGFDLDGSKILVDKFYSVRESALQRYNRRIESIFACDFYENNFQLVLALYEVIAFEIDDIVNHSHETFIQVNGMFFEMEYK